MSFPYLQSVLPTGAALCGLLGAACDLRTRRLPNLLTGPALLLGIALHTVSDGWRGLGSSLSAAMLCGGLFLIFYLAGGMGAGDVKMIAAEGSLLGISHAAPLLALTAISGGVLGIAIAVRQGRFGQTIRNVLALTVHHTQHGLTPHPELQVLNESTLRLPYGVAIAAGALWTIWTGPTGFGA